ncbi:MAG: hypothetical protein EHM88_14985 [Candidatus Rokuibacteriota bacterium]|nr:MAG: hypothetical protein EHM88_14985 [Candidatus Rokubacteria bacterium]
MEALWVVLPAGQRASGEWIDDTLRRRAEESGLLSRTPLAGKFPRQRVEVVRAADPVEEVNALFEARGWTDGLPVVPPTLARVEAMGAATARAPSEVLGEVEPLRGEATVEKIAANAVMAGCRPEHFPVVLAAVEAVLDPAFNMRGVQTTDENVAPLIVVSGPLAARLGINAGFGALGPGWRANAAIGRAVRLVMLNLGGGWPGAVSLAGLGQPGRYTLCLAEREDSPWPPLHVELGYGPEQSTVTVLRAETVVNVTGGLAEVASVMASAASAFTMLHEGRVAVVIAPFVARRLAAQGWSKDDVRRRLHAQARVPVAAWQSWWLRATARRWPTWITEAPDTLPVVKEPGDITLVVAGADLAIPQLAYVPSWGFPPCRVTREIAAPIDLVG